MLERLPGMNESSPSHTAISPVSDKVWQDFLAVLHHLPPDARAVLLLHDVLGVNLEDIPALLGLHLSACRQRLDLARSRMHSRRDSWGLGAQ
ncbi:sigma factor-like helix-turn-helix DNA-binding protein [Stenotrophomonas indicatrix]|uniref:sigma factor-like helix-turn-helix DNA-binding protein n=1 Tax=Stenotrophomonas indicatrix TaxID=2045451 RepID=UPI002810EEF1|nr:sigma factor-like helix-turn-helix DNA-binding protein [Stenotrophomonas indicatrix]